MIVNDSVESQWLSQNHRRQWRNIRRKTFEVKIGREAHKATLYEAWSLASRHSMGHVA